MSAETDPLHGARRPARALSPLSAALGLAAIAVVAAGGAWMGHADARVRPAAVPSTEAAPRGAIAADARVLLDGGNAAFRAGQYEAALAHYRAAAQRAPGHAAPWYGIHMAAQQLGRPALADSALAAIRARSGDSAAWDEGAVRRAHGAGRGDRPAPQEPRR